ncbi:hypothetical protein PAPHI01_0069 [Pancytospora philotis]|nr:hypothetical protein PAPHI01_0069 [Pancytospora philotis]
MFGSIFPNGSGDFLSLQAIPSAGLCAPLVNYIASLLGFTGTTEMAMPVSYIRGYNMPICDEYCSFRKDLGSIESINAPFVPATCQDMMIIHATHKKAAFNLSQMFTARNPLLLSLTSNFGASRAICHECASKVCFSKQIGDSADKCHFIRLEGLDGCGAVCSSEDPDKLYAARCADGSLYLMTRQGDDSEQNSFYSGSFKAHRLSESPDSGMFAVDSSVAAVGLKDLKNYATELVDSNRLAGLKLASIVKETFAEE